MTAQVFSFAQQIPVGGSSSNPQVFDIPIPAGKVSRIEVTVPPGPAGTLAFAIGAGGQPIVPTVRGTWIVVDNANLGWDLQNTIESGAWQVIGYNVGRYAHTVYVRISQNPPGLNLPTVVAGTITPAQLAPAAATAAATSLAAFNLTDLTQLTALP